MRSFPGSVATKSGNEAIKEWSENECGASKMASLLSFRVLPPYWSLASRRTLFVGACLGAKAKVQTDPVQQLFIDKLQVGHAKRR